MPARDLSNLLERLEVFEERLGVELNGLYASWDDTRLRVNGEIHVRSGSKIDKDIDIQINVYDGQGRVTSTDSVSIEAEKFFAFETFSEIIYNLDVKEIKRIRVFPKEPRY